MQKAGHAASQNLVAHFLISLFTIRARSVPATCQTIRPWASLKFNDPRDEHDHRGFL
jgi:hypothetical protein